MRFEILSSYRPLSSVPLTFPTVAIVPDQIGLAGTPFQGPAIRHRSAPIVRFAGPDFFPRHARGASSGAADALFTFCGP